jgi:FkbM family methyltransferase
MVRAARFALHRSRLDLPNDPRSNGERALQGWLLATLPAGAPLTAFDVGAHVGRWSGSLLELARHTGHLPHLHAFEPASDTHRRLVANLPGTVTVNRLAVSDRTGEVTLHLVGPGAGRNSLHQHDGPAGQAERVGVTTIDDYAARAGIDHIDLLKIDTEGHDVRVLHGARRFLGSRAVSVAQFEYNHRWVHARHFLKDAFDLLGPHGYRIGKLTPRGVEWYPAWDPDLETFVEGNYLACTAPMARLLPGVRWWKEGAGSCTSA